MSIEINLDIKGKLKLTFLGNLRTNVIKICLFSWMKSHWHPFWKKLYRRIGCCINLHISSKIKRKCWDFWQLFTLTTSISSKLSWFSDIATSGTQIGTYWIVARFQCNDSCPRIWSNYFSVLIFHILSDSH